MKVQSAYWRLTTSIFLILSWLIFIFFTSHSEEYYRYRNLKPVHPGEVIDWREAPAKIILSGWSGAENNFRWSQETVLGICFKPDPASLQFSNLKPLLNVSIDISPVSALVGKEFQMRLAPNGKENHITIINGRSTYTLSERFEMLPGIVCLTIKLPLTVKAGSQDPRNIGVALYNITYNFGN